MASENIVGKRENTGNHYFVFPEMFSTPLWKTLSFEPCLGSPLQILLLFVN